MVEDIVGFLRAIHALDISIIILIAGLTIYGFTKGAANVAVILIAAYLGFAIASIYYAPMGRIFAGLLGIGTPRVAEIVAFLVLNAFMGGLLAALLFNVLGNLQLPGRAGAFLDRPAGMFTGFAAGVFIAAIFIVLLSVPYQNFDDVRAGGGQVPLFAIFNNWYQASTLGPQLQKLGPYILSSIAPLTNYRVPTLLTTASAFVPMLFLLNLKLQADVKPVETAVK